MIGFAKSLLIAFCVVAAMAPVCVAQAWTREAIADPSVPGEDANIEYPAVAVDPQTNKPVVAYWVYPAIGGPFEFSLRVRYWNPNESEYEWVTVVTLQPGNEIGPLGPVAEAPHDVAVSPTGEIFVMWAEWMSVTQGQSWDLRVRCRGIWGNVNGEWDEEPTPLIADLTPIDVTPQQLYLMNLSPRGDLSAQVDCEYDASGNLGWSVIRALSYQDWINSPDPGDEYYLLANVGDMWVKPPLDDPIELEEVYTWSCSDGSEDLNVYAAFESLDEDAFVVWDWTVIGYANLGAYYWDSSMSVPPPLGYPDLGDTLASFPLRLAASRNVEQNTITLYSLAQQSIGGTLYWTYRTKNAYGNVAWSSAVSTGVPVQAWYSQRLDAFGVQRDAIGNYVNLNLSVCNDADQDYPTMSAKSLLDGASTWDLSVIDTANGIPNGLGLVSPEFAVHPTLGTRYIAFEYSDDSGSPHAWSVFYQSPAIYDDFNDEILAGWSPWASTWSAAGGYAHKTSSGAASIVHANTYADAVHRFSYYFDGTATSGDLGGYTIRYQSNNDKSRFVMNKTSVRLDKRVGGVWTRITSNNYSFPTAANTWYEVLIIADGDSIDVWRGIRGQAMTQVFDNEDSDGTVLSSAYIQLGSYMDDPPNQLRFDNVVVEPID